MTTFDFCLASHFFPGCIPG